MSCSGAPRLRVGFPLVCRSSLRLDTSCACFSAFCSPQLGAEEYQQATAAWLGRLTHVCLAANWLREMPVALLEHGAALEELDLAHNRQLQISAKAQRLLGRMPRCGVRVRPRLRGAQHGMQGSCQRRASGSQLPAAALPPGWPLLAG